MSRELTPGLVRYLYRPLVVPLYNRHVKDDHQGAMFYRIFIVFCMIFPPLVFCNDLTKYTFERWSTAQIPCLFGKGVVQSIYWTYYNGEDWIDVLTYFKGDVIYGSGYEGLVVLHSNRSTLIIPKVDITHEGQYACDVDRTNDTVVLDLRSSVVVFVRPDIPYPLIMECIYTRPDTICELEVIYNTQFNLTCQMSRFYPQDNALLEWRIQGIEGPQLMVNHSLENEDSTWNISSTLTRNISETVVYTCNATFVSAEGVDSFGASVKVSPEVLPHEGRSLHVGQIIGIIIGIIGIVICIAIGVLLWRHGKRKSEETSPNEGKRISEETSLNEDGQI